ncbi:stage II sporulation protein P [Paenibacillus sp.]|uniref:stage II sporulation protein P n=1 Tax=Paenibacillus sp. TaxID=58172 RepID=UPI002D4BA334|nr:stage II sporulation protein P [Paenibacillus sp.]HZG87329.1 stage II sporulation protein P [Paenibacillus sp.]
MKEAATTLAETLGALARAFCTVVAWCVVGAFVAITAVSILWKLEPMPVRSLDGAAASLPGRFYADMLGFEIAQLQRDSEGSSFSTRSVTSFLTRLTTGVDPLDPRTFAAQMLPGAQGDRSVILIHGIGTGPTDYPVEVPPAPHLQEPSESTPQPEGTTGEDPAASEDVPPENADEPPSSAGDPAEPPGEEAEPAPREPVPNVVFVYHSHPTESFLPELEGADQIDEAYEQEDRSKMITAVGERLAASLTELGVGALHSDEYYPWRGAYNESRKTVKAVMQQHEELQFFFDLHRDSARKEKTALVHEGRTYAKLFFVVGQKNPNYKENQKLAEELHYRVEEKIKGLSRGVVGKKEGSNGEFNQSLSPGSILIEVGGVDNTLEEAFRTVDVLAEVIAELYWERADAVETDAEPTPPPA